MRQIFSWYILKNLISRDCFLYLHLVVAEIFVSCNNLIADSHPQILQWAERLDARRLSARIWCKRDKLETNDAVHDRSPGDCTPNVLHRERRGDRRRSSAFLLTDRFSRGQDVSLSASCNGELAVKRAACFVADAALAAPSSSVPGRRDCAPIMVSKCPLPPPLYQLFTTLQRAVPLFDLWHIPYSFLRDRVQRETSSSSHSFRSWTQRNGPKTASLNSRRRFRSPDKSGKSSGLLDDTEPQAKRIISPRHFLLTTFILHPGLSLLLSFSLSRRVDRRRACDGKSRNRRRFARGQRGNPVELRSSGS